MIQRAVKFVVLLSAVLSLAPVAVWADDKRFLIKALVQDLGYGGAIHNYKNYVLRGEEATLVKARQKFVSAKAIVVTLRELNNISEDEHIALNDLERVIDSYIRALITVQRMYLNSGSLARVLHAADEKIHINDQAAMDALALLRSGYQWNNAERLVSALGYGGVIHNFKDYLIRRDEMYLHQADRAMDVAQKTLENMRREPYMTVARQQALAEVEKMVAGYQHALSLVARTLAPIRGAKSDVVISVAVRGADKANKIDDRPALEALALLTAQ